MQYIYSLFIILLSITAYAQPKTDWEIMNLKGKVKSITQKEYQLSARSNNTTKRANYAFNNKGYKTSENFYEDDEFTNGVDYKYNSSGQVLEEITKLGKNIIKRKYTYDSKKRTSKFYVYVANNVHIVTTTMIYDENNRLIEKDIDNIIDNKKSIRVETYKYQYNDKNLLSDVIQTIGDITKRTSYQYDDHNNLIDQSEFDTNDVLTHQITYKYDQNNHVIDELSAYRFGDTTRLGYVYTYDATGNWTNMGELMDGQTYNLVVREIQYYK